MQSNHQNTAGTGKRTGTSGMERRRIRLGGSDATFSIVVLILLGLGIVMMFSASYAIAINEGNPGYYYALRQIVFAGIGLVMMFVVSFIDYHVLQKSWIVWTAYIGSIVLLILVRLVGTDLGTGCKRWLNLGFTTFQPSELTKFAIVILFSYLIDKNFDRMKKWVYGIVLMILPLVPVVALLMKQPHLSCTILICMIAFTLLFIGGSKWWHLLVTAIAGGCFLVGIVIYKTIVENYNYFSERISTWLHPFESADLAGTWQTRQSLIAIGSGGLFGLGLGESRQKYLYLPESENDFVFSIVCEELGLLGAVTVILLFVLLIIQGFHIATNSKDRFGMLVAVGFTLQIGLQAFINIAVVSGLVPNTGISLPFFSYGGTALIMQLVEMGIVMNISRKRYVLEEPRQAAPPPEPEPSYREGA
jgi:cell division protein FtsW